MSESPGHKVLIDIIDEYVRYRFHNIVENGQIYIDNGGCETPILFNDSRPDYYAEIDDYIVIGEAKTHNDIVNEHTRKQFIDYLIRSKSALNEDINPVIVYSVPNDMVKTTRNYLYSLKNDNNVDDVEIIVISPLDLFIQKERQSSERIIVKREPPFETKIDAFDYQKKAFEKIKDLEYAGIFHEQGLGKTKIAIDLLVYWLKEKIVDTVIIITKKTLVHNWENEFIKHTTLVSRTITNSRKNNYFVFNSPCRVIITNFESVISEKERFELFLHTRFVGVIIDESAKIKNPNSKISKTLFELSSLFKRRIIMTGTPVANRPYDIWSQIFFLDSGLSLGTDFKQFKKVNDLSNKLAYDEGARRELSNSISSIFSKIETFSVRETKNSGIIALPPKEYFSVEVPFEIRQKEMYDKIRSIEASEIVKNGEIVLDDISSIIKRLTRLVEITSNPNLVDESYLSVPQKVIVMKELVDTIVDRDEKVIVWTMYIDNVKMIKKHLSQYNPVEISGKMNIDERNKSVDKFINDPNIKVLVATNAAKEGLTLTIANNAIFYDRSLSLDDYLQAQDRIHRISQNEICHIYNLKVSDSIDEWIDLLLSSKELAAKVAQGDITQKDYDSSIDYSFGQIIKNILGVE